MSKRKVLMAGVALAALAFSASAQAETTTKHGMYVGGFGGYGWTDANLNPGPTVDIDGAEYGVFAGYQIDSLFGSDMGISGALEGHYGWSNADGAGLEKDHEWGLSFRPGLTMLSDVMGLRPYGILGYRRAEFETAAGVEDNYDGFELGIGAEVFAQDAIGVRVDYAHVFYGEENGVDPSENDLRAGLVFHF